MTRGLLFWIIMLLWLIFGLWFWWPAGPGLAAFAPLGGHLIVFVLLAIVGWQVFGPPVRG